ncbi:MAG: hypothetical protein ACHQ2Z_14010 [Elusimicrobiota bacterium]
MKNRMMAVPAVLLAAAAAMSGCSSMAKSYPLSTPNVEILPLHRAEYVILGDTEGQACESYLFGFIPLSGDAAKFVNQPGQLINTLPKVESAALYDAIDKVPGADSIMSVRVSVDTKFSVPGIYKHECVTVKGKAFELKTDAQAAAQ